MKKSFVLGIVLMCSFAAKAQAVVNLESAKMSPEDTKKVMELAKKLDVKAYEISITNNKKTSLYGGLNAGSVKQGSTAISKLPASENSVVKETLRSFIGKVAADPLIVKQLEAIAAKYKQ
jgi:hypothetical protein